MNTFVGKRTKTFYSTFFFSFLYFVAATHSNDDLVYGTDNNFFFILISIPSVHFRSYYFMLW